MAARQPAHVLAARKLLDADAAEVVGRAVIGRRGVSFLGLGRFRLGARHLEGARHGARKGAASGALRLGIAAAAAAAGRGRSGARSRGGARHGPTRAYFVEVLRAERLRLHRLVEPAQSVVVFWRDVAVLQVHEHVVREQVDPGRDGGSLALKRGEYDRVWPE